MLSNIKNILLGTMNSVFENMKRIIKKSWITRDMLVEIKEEKQNTQIQWNTGD